MAQSNAARQGHFEGTKLASHLSLMWPSQEQRDEATLKIPRKLIYQCQQGVFAFELTLGPYPNLTRCSNFCLLLLVPQPSDEHEYSYV